MKAELLFVAAALAVGVAAKPTTGKYVVHQKRDVPAFEWSETEEKLDRRSIIPMSISLTQRNLENGYDFVMDVSDPKSENYGKHWSAGKIVDMFAPSDEAISSVKAWVNGSGISDDRIRLSTTRTWLHMNVSVAEAESLLQTEYKLYEHAIGKRSVACDQYSIPAGVQEYVEYITPTIELQPMTTSTIDLRSENIKRQLKDRHDHPDGKTVERDAANANTHLAPGQYVVSGITYEFWNLTVCPSRVTPECIRQLYSMPNGTHNLSSLGVYESGTQNFVASDLALFYTYLAPVVPSDTLPIVRSIDGGTIVPNLTTGTIITESNMDLVLTTSLTYPQQVTLFQVGDLIMGGSFDQFLDGVDGSYCTYDGGDAAGLPPVYPDTSAGGYNATDCGLYDAPSVISLSYGYVEAGYPASALVRECNEWMKMALLGLSVLAASGDSGVAGYASKCCINPGCVPSADGSILASTGKTFEPLFPGTCPYVTSVGGTMINFFNASATVYSPEVTWDVFGFESSGGGFSNVFPMPDYQADAVNAYLTNYPPPYTSAQYNNSGNARAIPDISANALFTSVVLAGSLSGSGGTSAAAPIAASVITLINNERIAAGKGPVGFINPVLYANPQMMNDIVSGTNPGCGSQGFAAAPGWDPSTGFGTPNYERMLDVWLALP